jgi:hypothetical protein
MKTTVLFAALLMLASAVRANPICDVARNQAQEDLKQELLHRYGSHYSTVEMLLNAGMRDYDILCQVPDNSVNNGILEDLKARYYPNFSTILMLYKANKKSYENLSR